MVCNLISILRRYAFSFAKILLEFLLKMVCQVSKQKTKLSKVFFWGYILDPILKCLCIFNADSHLFIAWQIRYKHSQFIFLSSRFFFTELPLTRSFASGNIYSYLAFERGNSSKPCQFQIFSIFPTAKMNLNYLTFIRYLHFTNILTTRVPVFVLPSLFYTLYQILTAVNELFQDYCAKVYSISSVKQMLILKN